VVAGQACKTGRAGSLDQKKASLQWLRPSSTPLYRVARPLESRQSHHELSGKAMNPPVAAAGRRRHPPCQRASRLSAASSAALPLMLQSSEVRRAKPPGIVHSRDARRHGNISSRLACVPSPTGARLYNSRSLRSQPANPAPDRPTRSCLSCLSRRPAVACRPNPLAAG